MELKTVSDMLASNPILLLFSVIGLGYLLGNIRIFGFNLSGSPFRTIYM
jgi:uncharacterized transporter YbjL